MIIGRTRRIWRRYREIARVLARHGLGWMLVRIGLPEHRGEHGKLTKSEHAPAHIREIMEELGPAFVKLGQLLSSRPDIVPEAYVVELSKLQDTAPTIPFDQIREVIEDEFHAPLRDLFASFDEQPLAAASLGQVHRAILLDGTSVIVKVQRPDIRDVLDDDLEILRKRAAFLESHWDRARIYGVTEVVDEFATTLREELDYTREGSNTDRLREDTASDRGVLVPNVHWELTSNRVLTLEEIEGVKVTDVMEGPLSAEERRELADRLATTFLKQIFVSGFFHADPHPGNILITTQNEIALVDCGQVRRLDVENKTSAIRMLVAFEQQDTRMLAGEILNIGIARGEVDSRGLTMDLGKVLREYYDVRSKSVQMGRLLTRVLNVSAHHGVRLPVVFAVMGKVLTGVDAICSRLDPGFNFTDIARRVVGRAVRSELRQETLMNDFYRAIGSLRSLFFAMPEQLERLMRKAVEGTLRVEFKHQGLDEVEDTFARSANRISIALIVAGTIVGSSLIVSAGRGSKGWFGLPQLGLLGFTVATVFGIWLIVSILRSHRHG